MELVENYISLNGTKLCWFEQGKKNAGDETFLLVHATGFHARCWDAIVRRMPGKHIIALDMRGHGRSSDNEPFGWDTFGQDLTDFVEALDLARIVGVGHSMGGHCLTQAACRLGERFSRLVLVDPVIMAPEIYQGGAHVHSAWLDESGVHPVARRRNQFADADALYHNLHGRGGYAQWQDEVLMDYCRHGVLPAEDGVVLACPPRVEAAIYMGSSQTDVHEQVAAVEVPVKVLRARQREGDRSEMDFSVSPTWPGLAQSFSQGVDVYLPELSHFIPMQDPALMAAHILEQAKTT